MRNSGRIVVSRREPNCVELYQTRRQVHLYLA